jgi:hypothetical protein
MDINMAMVIQTNLPIPIKDLHRTRTRGLLIKANHQLKLAIKTRTRIKDQLIVTVTATVEGLVMAKVKSMVLGIMATKPTMVTDMEAMAVVGVDPGKLGAIKILLDSHSLNPRDLRGLQGRQDQQGPQEETHIQVQYFNQSIDLLSIKKIFKCNGQYYLEISVNFTQF